MFDFKGNISGEVTSQPLNLATVINNFSLVNKSGVSAMVNVYLIDNSNTVNLIPSNLTLDDGDLYVEQQARLVTAQSQIKVTSSATISYDFNLDNTTP